MPTLEKIYIIVLDVLGEIWSSGAFYMFFLTLAALVGLAATEFFWRAGLKSLYDFARSPQKDWVWACATGAAALALFVVYSSIHGLPSPSVHDENCYLLMAKTFAHGRLTNEAHPLWQFFEHFHLLNQPTYTAKYPPAQAFFLAIGILLFDQPIAGVWLSGAIAGAACFWMLRAFVPPVWSFGCVLLLFTVPTVFEWSQNYWGGFVALTGGAICFGALLRFLSVTKISLALWFGLGLSILANTRPFEGALTCLPLSLLIFYRIGKNYRDREYLRVVFGKFVIPVILILTANFVWMGYYNSKVTGSALKMPYALYTRQYDPVPLFLPFPARTDLAYRHEVMKVFYSNELQLHFEPLRRSAAKATLPVLMVKRAFNAFNAFFYSALFIYLGLIVYGIFVLSADRKYYFFAAGFFGCLYLETLATYNQNHYYAPFVPLLLCFWAAALSTGARKFQGGWRKNISVSLLPAVILAQAFWLFVLPPYFKSALPDPKNSQFIYEKTLAAMPGRHLVLVDYSTGDLTGSDGRYNKLTAMSWVYNDPDIDESKVVWANDMGSTANRQIFEYFPDRHIWMLGFDRDDTAKLVSCEDARTQYEPSPELAEALRKGCPSD
ncbi:MAG TPA: hypothetical protein VIL74_05080 [Pyrinomonadaceae bacterium]|jgi:hypothetical protein